MEPLRSVERGFGERVASTPAVSTILAGLPRTRLAIALAVLPAVIIFIVALVVPPGFAETLTSTGTVRATFSRFITATATASSIAVSVALIAMRRELRGVSGYQDAKEANVSFRDSVREQLGVEQLPVALPDIMVALHIGLARIASHTRASAGDARRIETSGVRLDDFLATLARQSRETARRLEAVRRSPDRVYLAALEQETTLTAALLRRFLRAPSMPVDVRERLQTLEAVHDHVIIAQRYTKTLDLQWGLSAMSESVLITTLPALLAATLVALAYVREGIPFGMVGALALVCGLLAVVLLPLTLFISHLLGFVFLNRHTLPTDGFALGPEETGLLRSRPAGGGRARG